jgi:hypothetical protein
LIKIIDTFSGPAAETRGNDGMASGD